MRVPPDQSTTARGRAVERAVRVAPAELARDARQPRAEHERLDARARARPPRAGTGAASARTAPSSPRRRRRARAAAAAATGSRQRRSSGSPPWRSDARTVACRSGRTPRRRVAPRAPRRAHRPVLGEARISRRAGARSASVYVGEVLVAQQLDLAVGGGRGLGSLTVFGCAPSGGGAATRGSAELGALGMPARSGGRRRRRRRTRPRRRCRRPDGRVRCEHSTARSAR